MAHVACLAPTLSFALLLTHLPLYSLVLCLDNKVMHRIKMFSYKIQRSK